MPRKRKDFTDITIGKFTAIKYIKTENEHPRYLWLCVCGNTKEAIPYDIIKNGVCKKCKIIKSKTRLYRRWKSIKYRCYNPNHMYYYRYGGRGIIMCDEWKNDFTRFEQWAINNGYAENLVIDRIDNDGNYAPENCRWVTHKENCNNRGKCKSRLRPTL